MPAVPRSSHARFATSMLIVMLLMLTCEGALRKWISTGLTVPLIGLRDGCAIVVVVYAFLCGFLSPRRHVINAILLLWMCLVAVWGLVQILLGESNPLTLIIGLRFWCLYIAFGIAIGQMIDREGVIRFIKISLWVMILMAPLAVLQFVSPPAAFINRQVDGDESKVFTVVFGIVRTTGTFSFTFGYTALLGLLTPVVLACFMEYRNLGISRRLAFAGMAAMATCTAVAGSRAATILFAALIVCGALVGLLAYQGVLKRKAVLMLGGAALLVLGGAVLLPAAFTSMETRFHAASKSENFVERVGTIFLGDSMSYEIATWHGLGLGAGSGLGSYVATGERQFVAGEAESGRILAEGGVVGALYLLLKLVVIVGGMLKATIISMRSRSAAPALVWMGFAIAFLTWPSIGQLTAHAALGVYIALALFVLRPVFRETTR